ncbi:ATP-dependent DNA helicase [Telmatospirillum siberiense]|uniref:ATP-dependent DNA helicase n=1 Tax=Telmatospirillum siberiense TaxID=382514 RepID=A0A2N3PPH9_9PROT|nr:ATP-dependent DNA helicase [Telmatospirillum siberiense]PKU22302.1 ATP-dependent DNA helicase [Telmatospirillum siberiense]
MSAAEPPRLLLPAVSALVAHPGGAQWLSADGEMETLKIPEAIRRLRAAPVMLVHRPAVAARLAIKGDPFPAFDLLELFAFVRPATFCVPTVRGLADALDLPVPHTHEDEVESLARAARHLLDELVRATPLLHAAKQADARGLAWVLARAGWPWASAVLAALGGAHDQGRGASALQVWDRLGEWSDHAPEPPPGNVPVEPGEARQRLAEILGQGAEQRPTQADYASAAALAFAPRQMAGAPNLVLAEAGTGTGKTLGYIAPASLWAEKNLGPVWISTYTRNLQRQLDGELGRLYPDPALKARKVVIRKGRENYLCLLNLEEAVQRFRARKDGGGDEAVALALMARWVLASRDGDMVGGDLPGWLVDLLGKPRTIGLADRRGECIYSACPHFRKCFIEKTVRRARRADIVVANHALVMMQAAFGGLDDGVLPTRYVFDEGHHVFEAADSGFSADLSGMEAAELRRWLLGAESDGARTRARGLKRRCEDLLGGQQAALTALDDALQAARQLPSTGWHQRLAEGQPQGAAETFLTLLRQQVYARTSGPDSPYSLECDPRPPVDGLIGAAEALSQALDRLAKPLRVLSKALGDLLDDEAAELETATRGRIEAIMRSIDRRALTPAAAWRDMLGGLSAEPREEFVDWFAVERIDGRDIDIGFSRHWIDPTIPFAKFVAAPAHGVLITSATLRDGTGETEADWDTAEQRTGAHHLPLPAVRAAVASPFDYVACTRVLVITDVRKDDLAQVAAAYRELFKAAGGGGLGLFTAVSRLKEVWRRIREPLDACGIDLLAQHVEGMDTSTIVDIFRAEEDACLLGTDAVRDGVDVPGRSLRLIVFDRVPWPRPDILHKARRAAFGGKAYDDMITRLRLKQAFGRLIRRSGDAGLFVLLDPMMPSRLAGAFPPGVVPERVGLAEAVAITKDFLGRNQAQDE